MGIDVVKWPCKLHEVTLVYFSSLTYLEEDVRRHHIQRSRDGVHAHILKQIFRIFLQAGFDGHSCVLVAD